MLEVIDDATGQRTESCDDYFWNINIFIYTIAITHRRTE